MTEKDLKSMYDKISLSETRMTELEKKLPEMFAEAETSPKMAMNCSCISMGNTSR